MYGHKTFEWFGIQSATQDTNTAPACTGCWIKLNFHLPRQAPEHPRFWRRASQLLRLARPDLADAAEKLKERQAQKALSNLLHCHANALNLPAITVAQCNLVAPEAQHWVALHESRQFSHALTAFAVLTKTTGGLFSARRSPNTSVLYVPRRIKQPDNDTSIWEVALWLESGFSDLVACALRSPANHIKLESLL